MIGVSSPSFLLSGVIKKDLSQVCRSRYRFALLPWPSTIGRYDDGECTLGFFSLSLLVDGPISLAISNLLRYHISTNTLAFYVVSKRKPARTVPRVFPENPNSQKAEIFIPISGRSLRAAFLNFLKLGYMSIYLVGVFIVKTFCRNYIHLTSLSLGINEVSNLLYYSNLVSWRRLLVDC